MHYAFQYLLVL